MRGIHVGEAGLPGPAHGGGRRDNTGDGKFFRLVTYNVDAYASVAEWVQERGVVVFVRAQLPHAVLNDGDTVSVSLDRV